MKKLATATLIVAFLFMVCGFSFKILCAATSRFVYVAANNEVYLQLNNRYCMPEYY